MVHISHGQWPHLATDCLTELCIFIPLKDRFFKKFLIELQLDGLFFLCEGVEGSLGPNGIPIQLCPESLLITGNIFF